MKTTALAPWFGSKRNLAPAIVEAMGPHRVYWEPFCGSLAVLLNKPPCIMETANDLHGDLINLARVLKLPGAARDLYGRVRGLVFHEDLFRDACARYRARGRPPAGLPDVDRAEDFLVTSWFGRNGVTGTGGYNRGFCVRYTANGGHAAKRWDSVVESIPDWHERLRNVTILNRDAFEILAKVRDDPGTAIYADPPYLEKNARYTHDFAAPDHTRLAEALRRFKRARVVVSYYAHPRLAELYPGWAIREHVVTKALVNQGTRDTGGATKATEVLVINERSRGLFD